MLRGMGRFRTGRSVARRVAARSAAARLLAALGIALSPVALPPAARAQESAAAEVADDAPPTREAAEAARIAFREAETALKKAIGELTSLQTEYQRQGADRPALEAKFEIARKGAEESSQKLEQSAFTIARAGLPRRGEVDDYGTSMPLYKDALQVCGAMVATAIQTDDPAKALRLLDQLEKVGAIDGDMLMMGATASMLLSRIDDAQAYLDKLSGVGGSDDKQAQVRELADTLRETKPKIEDEMKIREAEAAADDLPRVRISTSVGDLVVELFENEAPNTVANFISLVESGLYDGTPFHRVIPGFMAQGGDPTGRGNGGPGYAIRCETDRPDARKHFLGSLSMAHAGKDTGGSQFFLTFRPTEHLDGKHTVFGRIVEGMETLSQIRRTQSEEGRPIPGVKPDSIVKAEVIRKRPHDYAPEKLPDPKQ